MEKPKSFTAIDFETLTAERTSACAIGLVKVIDGQITQKFYSLINPIPDDRDCDNSAVHGITRQMVESAPTFAELWQQIHAFVGSDILVAHNAEFDNAVWNAQHEYYRCTSSYIHQFLCTFELTGKSLDAACANQGIELGHHHDALDDALACARLLLAESGTIMADTFKGGIKSAMSQIKAKKYEHSTLEPIDDVLVADKSTPFYHARTVITGTFSAYPNRNDLGKILQGLGADINTSISKLTNVVVIGAGAGPAKLSKIQQLRDKGFDIRIIYEPELISILS